MVHLAGSLRTAGSSQRFATLPAGLRPAHNLYIKAYTVSETVGTVLIEPNGAMLAFSLTPADAHDFTSLATISFPLKS